MLLTTYCRHFLRQRIRSHFEGHIQSLNVDHGQTHCCLFSLVIQWRPSPTTQRPGIRRLIIHVVTTKQNNSLNPENETADYKVGESLIISGWGSTRAYRKKRSSPAILQEAVIEIKSQAFCQQSYGRMFKPSLIFCASGKGIDSCQGYINSWRWLCLFGRMHGTLYPVMSVRRSIGPSP